ncbi:uncharacterized protein LOC126755829 [Bactrocera neohumeralis]|uniref:uncharacterized protein LOC126755829 n=1 Tax=Bactrocera neohumeralis TaxID=98809 RepID=UPI002165EF38|nr:uncharacterized protein LOC126755829 [Bactrocera neohumeralis]
MTSTTTQMTFTISTGIRFPLKQQQRRGRGSLPPRAHSMMADVMEIAEVNLHHAAAASAVITSRLTAEKLGALLIQEPWVYKGEIKGLKTEANKVIWDLSSERPRTCIVVRSNIDFFCISEFLTQDLVAVQARDTEGKDLVLASAYFPGKTATAPPEAVERLVEHCKRHKLPLIIGCDANAHHTEWGSTDCNARGGAAFTASPDSAAEGKPRIGVHP